MPTESTVIAALDMGTNTFKMSVFVERGGTIDEIASDNRVLRVARLIDSHGVLPESAVESIVDAVNELAEVGERAGATRFVGVATQGFRMATNGEAVLGRIAAESPWEIRMISGAEEAELTFEGLVDYMPESGTALIVDIGGGSTELVLVSDRRAIMSESLRVGSGVLTDRCVTSDPPLEAELQAASVAAESAIAASAVAPVHDLDVMVLSGGAGQFLDAIALKRLGGGLDGVHLQRLSNILLRTPSAELAGWLGIPAVRAQVIPAGHRIALAAAARYRPRTVQAAPSGIRLGLVRRYLRKA